MPNRSETFSDLKSKFEAWLPRRGVVAAAGHYVTNLEAVGNPIAPHTSVGGAWHGLCELLTGNRPQKGVYNISGITEFVQYYGNCVAFFLVERDKIEDIRQLYPHCAIYDELFNFAHSTSKSGDGDGGHTRSAFNKYCQFLYELEAVVDPQEENLLMSDLGIAKQVISYGAPGTGKSKDVNDTARTMPSENVIRTTFHPDSDYSTFVGAYKPTMVPSGNEKKISYEFVPQAFAKAYVQAWKKMAKPEADGKVAPVLLVIEEINRGDCAKVFGDLFQLLDRRVADDGEKKAGFSEYPVLADSDLADYIRKELESDKDKLATNYPTVVALEKLELILPPNLYIWATMNTSDQSLFPMDSAFKRRWDWKYVPIKDAKKDWKIVVGKDAQKKEYVWWDFLLKINQVVEDVTSSEDKKLGYFFAKTPDGVIGEEMLVNKVFFFLWNDVFKDVVGESRLQLSVEGKERDLRFHHFFKDEDGTIDCDRVKAFLDKLGVHPPPPPAPEAGAEPDNTEHLAGQDGQAHEGEA